MNQNKRQRLQFDDSSADSDSTSSRFIPPTRNSRQLNNNNAVGAETSTLEAEEEEAAIATSPVIANNNNNNVVHNEEAAEEVDDTIQSNIKDHHLVATLTTVICTHKDCSCKIAVRGSGLWIVSRQTIDRHLTNNNCWDNSKKKPSMRKLQKQLIADQIAKHNRIQNNPQLAQRMIDEEFPSNCIRKDNVHYCDNCGFSAKRAKNLSKHYGTDNQYGCVFINNAKRGEVITNQYGITIPLDILKQIQLGKFKLPYPNPLQQQQPPPPPPHIVVPTLPPLPATVSPSRLPPTPQESVFTASEAEMETALAQSSPPTAINNQGKVWQSLQCFVDASKTTAEKEKAYIDAYRHVNVLLPIIDETEAPQFRARLIEMSQQLDEPFNSQSDPTVIRVLLKAVALWFESGAANLDVCRCSANVRRMLYQLGSQADLPSEEVLLQGSTFVPSGKTKYIITECEKLILFLSRNNWSGMSIHLTQAETIYNSIQPSVFDNEEDAIKIAASYIVDTSIIPGLLVTVMLEMTASAGTNMIAQFLAARSISTAANRDHLEFKSANGIAKNTNSLLRLLRHAACSLIVRKRREITSLEEGERYILNLCIRIQRSQTLDHTARRIRTAREIDRLNLPNIFKGFDPNTGQIMVKQVYIDHAIWSNAIPTTRNMFHNHLSPLFACEELLNQVLDPNNKLILTGRDSTVTVNTQSDSTDGARVIDICSELIVCLDGEEVQEHINALFGLTMVVLLYLSAGAGRGIEVSRIGDFHNFCDYFQEYFNHLRFGMRSEKNINHGVDNNSQ